MSELLNSNRHRLTPKLPSSKRRIPAKVLQPKGFIPTPFQRIHLWFVV
jgi:hypothetical protein